MKLPTTDNAASLTFAAPQRTFRTQPTQEQELLYQRRPSPQPVTH